MRRVACAALIILAMNRSTSGQTQRPVADGEVLRLWSGAAPGALGESDADIPALTVYLPRATAAAVDVPAIVVCPGGGYRNLATNHEGRQVANYLNSLGMAAFVLRYRLGPQYHHPVELGDVQRAIRTLRSHAAAWHVAANRIGVLGFSAGGHLVAAMSNATARAYPRVDAADDESSRPDFAVALYPGHLWNGHDLDLYDYMRVSAATPPTFLIQAEDDPVDDVRHSLSYYMALREAHVPTELHLYAHGGHAFGLRRTDQPITEWPALAERWLRTIGMVRPT